MKPLIVYNYYGVLDGVFASVIDMYYNLSEYMDVDLKITTDRAEECICHLFKNNNRDLVSNVTVDNVFSNEIIICSVRLLYDEVSILKCDKLILLDSLDLSKSIYGVYPRIFQYIPADLEVDQVIFLSNKTNIMKNCVYKQIEYYQKLNSKRLDNHPLFYIRHIDDYPLKKKYFHDIYNYRRTDKKYGEIKRNCYFENMGRGIFEHIYFNKIVNYYSDGLVKKDGLYYYLKLFGIDGKVNYSPLPIDKKMVQDVLFMNDDDPILNLL